MDVANGTILTGDERKIIIGPLLCVSLRIESRSEIINDNGKEINLTSKQPGASSFGITSI